MNSIVNSDKQCRYSTSCPLERMKWEKKKKWKNAALDSAENAESKQAHIIWRKRKVGCSHVFLSFQWLWLSRHFLLFSLRINTPFALSFICIYFRHITPLSSSSSSLASQVLGMEYFSKSFSPLSFFMKLFISISCDYFLFS